jgi:hypothetical protein
MTRPCVSNVADTTDDSLVHSIPDGFPKTHGPRVILHEAGPTQPPAGGA